MKFFLDTEFSERGPQFPVTLISIGIVDERGGKFYAVSSEFRDEDCNQWVRENVLPHLGDSRRLSLNDISILVREWVDVQNADGDKPEFWGYYADYDWVVTAQIFGTMMDLPDGWPMYCRDIKQLCDSLGNPKLPEQISTEHNALADAQWNKQAYGFLATMTPNALQVPELPQPEGDDGEGYYFHADQIEEYRDAMLALLAAKDKHAHSLSEQVRERQGIIEAYEAELAALRESSAKVREEALREGIMKAADAVVRECSNHRAGERVGCAAAGKAILSLISATDVSDNRVWLKWTIRGSYWKLAWVCNLAKLLRMDVTLLSGGTGKPE